MPDRTYFTILIYVKPGTLPLLRAYEETALPILQKHGGRFDVMLTPESIAGDLDLPDEIHVLSFADATGFDAYRQDPEAPRLAALRDEFVERAVFIRGKQIPPIPLKKD